MPRHLKRLHGHGMGIGAAFLWTAWLCNTLTAADYSLRVWRADEGLLDNRVTGIVQGLGGYLWIATYGGLCRFDGVSFERVDLPPVPGTPHNAIKEILLAGDQSIWLVLESGAALRVSNLGRTIQVITNNLPHSSPVSIAQDSAGAVWISYEDQTVRKIAGDQVTTFTSADGLPPGVSCWLATDVHGKLWFATRGYLGTHHQDRFVTLHSLPHPFLRLTGARDGGVWVRVASEIIKFREDAEPQVLARLPAYAKVHEGAVLFEADDGAVWVGTASSGLFRMLGDSVTQVETSHPEVRAVFQDDEGTLWVGTGGGGVNRLRPNVLELHNTKTGLPFDVVNSICEDNQGVLWVAMQNGMVARRMDAGWQRIQASDEWPANDATCLVAEPRGGIWIGTRFHGLYHHQDGEWVHWGSEEGLASRYVRSLLVDSSGKLWIGQHWSNCVQRLSAGQLHTFPLPEQSEALRAMTEDASGAVWAGDAEGHLYRIANDTVTNETARTLSVRRPIRTLSATADSSVWIGYANGGLGWLRPNDFVHIGPQSGLTQRDVSQVVADAEGNLWLGGDRGVSRIGREDLEAYAEDRTEQIPVTDFGINEGYANLQANYGVMPGGILSGDKRVWLPMRTGLLQINTEQARPNTRPPPVLIEKIWVDDRLLAWPPVDTAAESDTGAPGPSPFPVVLLVPPDHRKLDFNFTALSFVAPESMRFRCRLEGFEDAWVELGDRRQISYRRLPRGDYRFHVIACNNSGVWNETGAVLDFKVAPFFWQTVWFRITALAAFTLTVAGVVRYASFRRLRRQLQRFEQESVLHNERARIARDIHDDLGASLTQISLVSELARGDLGRPAEAERHMAQVAGQARQVIKTLDEIVWAVNPRNDTLAHLLEYIIEFAVGFLSAADIRCRVDFPEKPPEQALAGEDRHNLYLVVKESLNNVVKHAHASEVWLRAQVTPEHLSLSIEDNGQGLDPSAREAWEDGLRNMRQRLAAIGGSVEIRSAAQQGTTVLIRFPWPRR